ncbi:MAG: hydroxyethylthiazole kinase [Geminicoccaceae bacterium]
MLPEPTPDIVVSTSAALLERIRADRPRVHCLTNPVAMNLSANVLLAAGAIPSMTSRAESVADFVATSRALVVNLGMLDAEREAAILRAVPAANELGRPWLLDPVKIDRSPIRLAFARRLLSQGPAVLRANIDETAALGEIGSCVLASTGAVDRITDGRRTVSITNGSPLMDRVTAIGCAASALGGAFLAVTSDPFEAAVAALLVMAVAGEIAAARSRGPGSFQVELLDALYLLDADTLRARAHLQ